MTDEEEKAVLLAEMRIAGIPHQVVNFYRVYINCKFQSRHSTTVRVVRGLLPRELQGTNLDVFDSWLRQFGHVFEDIDNLPTNDQWSKP